MASAHRRCVVALALVAVAAACGGGDVARSYTIELTVDDAGDRYRYVTEDQVDVRLGDEVTFQMTNTGALIHDLQVVDPDGNRVAYEPPTFPGDVAAVTVLFDEAGFFRLNCLVDDHLTAHEMQTFFEVTDPDV